MKKIGFKILTITLVLFGLISCKKDPEVNIEEFEISSEELTVGSTSANIAGRYNYSGKIENMKVIVADNEYMNHAKTFEAELNNKAYAVEITDLKMATMYYYYYSIDYGFSKPYKTETKTFTTLSESPVVKTLEVLPLDSTIYRIKCEVVSSGGQTVSERGICWNTYGDPSLEDESIKHEQGGLGQYTIRMENLELATRYFVRAYAKNETGIGFGDVIEFKTGTEVTLPQVSTVVVESVTATTATIKGNVSNDGGANLMECGVCWSLTPEPGLSGSHQAVESPALGVFSVAITGLNPNATYHVRCYATNSKGTAYGEELTFATTAGLPSVTTSGITNITATSAKGSGNVTDEGESSVTERGICWSASHNPTTSGSHAYSGTGAGSYTVNMTGLTPNETYYVRAYAKNRQGTSYGSEVSFTALEGLPEVTTQEVSDVTANSAKGHGTVTDQGGSAVTERGICWSTDPSPTIANSHANSGTGVGSFTVNITALTPGTKYYVRAYAINTQGTTYGDQKEFITGANLPTVTTSTPTNVTQTTATGRGEVTDDGGATVTERGVCWSTSHNPTTNGSHASSGTGIGSFTVDMTNLTPGTTYYVRAYAVNSEGTAYGNEVTMATTADKPTVTTGSVSNITQTTALGSGTVTSDGGATVTERGVCWSTSHNPTTSGSHASNGTGTGSFTVNMAGLTSNTTYYVRAYATNSEGTSYGNEVSFTTAETVSAPTVTTGQVTNIAQTTATGAGNVTSDGGATVTERGVCWSTSHNPTTSGSHASNGTGTGTFSVNMTGLTANTTYYVRAYAINSQGTSYGDEVSFATSQIPNYTIAVSANPTAGGTVAGGGSYQQGQSCTVTATPATGYTFLRWTENGNQVSTNANYTFTVSANRTLVAQFQLQSYTISVSANPTAGGTVTGGGSFNHGQSCTVSATAATGYTFLRWTENGTQVSTNASYSFTVSGNRTLVANFEAQATLPTVTTSEVTNITQSAATGGGNVTATGGASVTERGICWSTSHNPTTASSHASNGTGTGSFTVNMTGLTSETTYYVRAYAVNSVGTAYGNEIAFTTIQPIGVINGLYSISETQQVYFSSGNLQYQASTNTWRFASNQYDYVGASNSQVSSNYSGWIDMFGWGTSGYDHGATCYQPWATCAFGDDYWAYGNSSYNLYDQTGQADWGCNPIENGGGIPNQWRTLTISEWDYILYMRGTVSGIRFAKANVNGVNGVILLPDNWNSSIYGLNNINSTNAPFNSNAIIDSQWTIFENAGAVFLPAAGMYHNNSEYRRYGFYWSASCFGSSEASRLGFNANTLDTGADNRAYAFSVRLVKDY